MAQTIDLTTAFPSAAFAGASRGDLRDEDLATPEDIARMTPPSVRCRPGCRRRPACCRVALERESHTCSDTGSPTARTSRQCSKHNHTSSRAVDVRTHTCSDRCTRHCRRRAEQNQWRTDTPPLRTSRMCPRSGSTAPTSRRHPQGPTASSPAAWSRHRRRGCGTRSGTRRAIVATPSTSLRSVDGAPGLDAAGIRVQPSSWKRQ